MKIKLKHNLPVDPVHGMTKDREFDVIDFDPEANRRNGGVRYWVMGDAGEKVGVLKSEAEVIEDEAA